MRCRLGRHADLLYYAFDLLYLDGYDLRRCALEDRKSMLAARLVGAPSRIHYSDHHAGDGPAFFKSACGMALEGHSLKAAIIALRDRPCPKLAKPIPLKLATAQG